MQKQNIISALRLIGPTAFGHYDIDRLIGPAQAGTRQAVMMLLTGAKIPKAKCGFYAVRQALYRAIGISPSCIRREDKTFNRYCKLVMRLTCNGGE